MKSLKQQSTITGNRLYFLDNLRTFMIFLVVMLHSGLVYEKSIFSSMYWIVYDPATNNVVGLLRVFLDIFVMAAIFFISGFLAPASLKNKGVLSFIKSKFRRLMIPWLIAVLTLIPLYKIIFLFSRNLPQQPWTTYFHWSNGMWSQNWLWFLPVLFLFNVVYILVSRPGANQVHLSLKYAIGLVFVTGLAYSIFMDIFNIQGWTKTVVLDFQNERLLIYFLMFLLGAICYKQNIFESNAMNKWLDMIIAAIVWLPVFSYRFFSKNAMITPDVPILNNLADTVLRWTSFHMSLLCLLYLLITTFRVFLDKQTRWSSALNKSSFHIYIHHTIVMGGLAMLLLDTALPSISKFLLLMITTFAASWLLSYVYQNFSKTKQKTIKMEKSTMKTLKTATLVIALFVVTSCAKQKSPVPQVDLFTATVFGKTDVALALIDAGADVNYQNYEGSTALITAAFFCRTEIVKALLDKGADKSVTNKAGRTALDAVSRPFEEVKAMYEGFGAALAPLGLQLDYEHIKAARPQIVEMLR